MSGALARRHAELREVRLSAANIRARSMALAIAEMLDESPASMARACELTNSAAQTLSTAIEEEDGTAVEICRAAVEHRRTHRVTYGWPPHLLSTEAEAAECARRMAAAWASQDDEGGC